MSGSIIEPRYIISERRLKVLLRAEWQIELLEEAGVDNWEWYDMAYEEYDGDVDALLGAFEKEEN